MSQIRRLSTDVASRIAAGEVIERPASVLKELIENGLDAGASKIQIESAGAGKTLLRVADDGTGMDPQDCRLAFEQHATSKIQTMEDLERLATFGFRGEALYSIAAVSHVTLASCPKNSRKGWAVEIAGGKLKGEHEAPPIAGTSIDVRNLFFNTPARAKFLKSDQVEKSHLARVVEEAALAHPEVSWVYKSENRVSMRFDHAEKNFPEALRSRVREVLGGDLGEHLLTAAETRPGLKIQAFLAPVDHLSATRTFQFLFVNRRPVTSRLLQQALYRAYEAFRARDRHPVAVVYLELPPDQFDVNVHPAKREVRFRNERALYEALTGAFSSALLRSKGIPTLDRTLSPSPLRGEGRGEGVRTTISPHLNPLPQGEREQLEKFRRIEGDSLVRESGAPYIGAPTTEPSSRELEFADSDSPGKTRSPLAPRWYTPPFTYLGQIEKTYLVFDAAGGLLVVDQHAAQERILFERYQAEMEKGPAKSQSLMLPIPIELPASQIQRILSRADRLRRTGFEVEPFGKTTLHVTAAPALFDKADDLQDMIHRLLESVQSESAALRETKHHAAATIACKAAVKAHDRLNPAEAVRLLEDLKNCEDGTACPHGRPSMIALNRDELARRFKRPGAP